RRGKSLAEIARNELGPFASVVVSLAILFIVVIALAGLGFVVVKALGGEEVKLPAGMQITLPAGGTLGIKDVHDQRVYRIPEGSIIRYAADRPAAARPEAFQVEVPPRVSLEAERDTLTLPAGCKQLVPGSSWGTF